MGLKSTAVRLAAGSPARCFPTVGAGADEAARWLRLDPGLTIVDSPRSADVLLVLGHFDADMLGAVAAIHDSIPSPRAVVTWAPDGHGPGRPSFAGAVSVSDPLEIGPAAVRARDELLAGRRVSTPDIQPDDDPAPWRGVGPFGQGGAGMTGGVPYGRPLAGRADDRDGLKLDQILVRVGPFLPPFPPGLMLDLKIQGDIVQEVHLPTLGGAEEDAVSGTRGARASAALTDDVPRPTDERALFAAALTRPVLVRDLEVARARHDLVWLAEMLRVCGLEAYGLRVLGLARALPLDRGEEVDDVARWLRRNVSLRWGTRKVGVLSLEQAMTLPGGPVVRAAGVAEDARSLDPAYERLGFTPTLATGSDALARWRLRVEEARQALVLADRAGDLLTTPIGLVEGPYGPVGGGVSASATLVAMLPDLLVGQEWGDAVTTVVSLDIDMADAKPADAGVGGGDAR